MDVIKWIGTWDQNHPTHAAVQVLCSFAVKVKPCILPLEETWVINIINNILAFDSGYICTLQHNAH